MNKEEDMKNLKPNKNQVVILLMFSLMIAVVAIYTNTANLSEISSMGGMSVKNVAIFTLASFAMLLLFEVVFDLNNDKKIAELGKEIEDIKNKLK
jgi:hypothetical protein